MAHKFFSSLDLNKCELKNHVLENLNADPATPIEGHIYYNTGSDKVKFYTNNSWNSLGSHVHSQSTSSSAWTVVHNLGRYPNVMVIDTGGNMQHGTVTHNSINQLTITFKSAGQAVDLTGHAYIN
jgi:hypothetical protein